MHLSDESFMIQRGSLVIARGYRGVRLTLLSVVGVRDAIVSVSPLPCICSRSRRYTLQMSSVTLCSLCMQGLRLDM